MDAARENSPLHIGLVGCGHMGSAMVKGWLQDDSIARITILDPNTIQLADSRLTHIQDISTFTATLESLDILILAVKPQIMKSVCEEIATQLPNTLPILSIAAGYSLASFYLDIPKEQTIIRAMPNTPGAIGKGITGALKTSSVTSEHVSLVEIVLSPLGKVIWVDDESRINAITAISGSGPAYVFYFIEALTKAAESLGLQKDDAMALARQTVIGAGALAESNSDVNASTLRKNVTSPGGTTEAALKVLMDGHLEDILKKATKAAKDRAKELS